MNENHTWTKAKLILIETVADVMFGNFLLILTKVPVLKCQKMALRVPKQKNGDYFNRVKNFRQYWLAKNNSPLHFPTQE